ncbi:MAG TPA: phosphate ABC transporter ATP-binding protein [Anaerolineaceae bacterium]
MEKAYENRVVLKIDALEIFPGEVIAFVGPSGSGKSTLLRLLNFLEPPDRGEIVFAGEPAGPGLPITARRQVTAVFQHPLLLRGSVESNIAYSLRLRGRRDHADEIERVINRLGLNKLQRSASHSLSGGEAQRVALARALAIHPRVLLLDEPTANLDPYNTGLIEAVVRELNQDEKTTVVLVTHNIFQARRLAHRTALLLGGEIVELAATRSFFETPQDPRTRAFVNGEMIY